MSTAAFSALYDRDPRRAWTPLMRGYQPWQLWDLTPAELDALVAFSAAPEAPLG